ncbi:hypothetical protein HYH02_012706 [Chlamydomonas schloesseri]|uniref:Methyltransferase type 11 domain-containing protein n=1 Tax=Chlamydomonas schloesseri TaxID=2026947 RepID=A0A835SU61_9CHLO|nr:hypothetical protein HYH02_012706 [Chlamydomonas schloesseri]|eukprot:KAG2433163.1 hypothetical protein HYH02_012706 [Chlamydomonas schloesseri]
MSETIPAEPGASDYEIYKEGFHDRLSRYWPEPREQLHAGGWQRTHQMLRDIHHLSAIHGCGRIRQALDLCCGEGATAVYVAAKEGWEVTGVEIVPTAAKVARARAKAYGDVVRVRIVPQPGHDGAASAVQLQLSYTAVEDLVRFAAASCHYMPLPSNSYDLVYGQDPDGLANEYRIHAFKEILRVLRPGGLFYFWHHWIPGPGWPAELLHEYGTDPVTGSPRLSFEQYVEDLEASGLQLVSATDCTDLAARHMGSMAARMRAEAGLGQADPLPDRWLDRSLQFAQRGGTMGIAAVAIKPKQQ